jgi:cytochrome c oxidase subunit II
MNFRFLPQDASSMAGSVDSLYYFLSGVTLFFTLLIFTCIVVFSIRYRRDSSRRRGSAHPPTLALEVTWTVIPLIIVLVMFGWGARVFYDLQAVPADAREIHVIGKQWMWKIHHPEGVREINELHVPLNATVKLSMTSQDVIHSFYIPDFRVKQDVVPGMYNSLWFRATKLGEFDLYCAEYCGNNHSRMIGKVVVMEPSEFESWMIAGGPRETLARQGEHLYRHLGCSGCHEPQSQIRAPSLRGLFGRVVPLEDGSLVVADKEYIRDSILLPQKHIAAGYQPIMPTFQGQLTEEQVLQLVEYIRHLGLDGGVTRP